MSLLGPCAVARTARRHSSIRRHGTVLPRIAASRARVHCAAAVAVGRPRRRRDRASRSWPRCWSSQARARRPRHADALGRRPTDDRHDRRARRSATCSGSRASRVGRARRGQPPRRPRDAGDGDRSSSVRPTGRPDRRRPDPLGVDHRTRRGRRCCAARRPLPVAYVSASRSQPIPRSGRTLDVRTAAAVTSSSTASAIAARHDRCHGPSALAEADGHGRAARPSRPSLQMTPVRRPSTHTRRAPCESDEQVAPDAVLRADTSCDVVRACPRHERGSPRGRTRRRARQRRVRYEDRPVTTVLSDKGMPTGPRSIAMGTAGRHQIRSWSPSRARTHAPRRSTGAELGRAGAGARPVATRVPCNPTGRTTACTSSTWPPGAGSAAGTAASTPARQSRPSGRGSCTRTAAARLAGLRPLPVPAPVDWAARRAQVASPHDRGRCSRAPEAAPVTSATRRLLGRSTCGRWRHRSGSGRRRPRGQNFVIDANTVRRIVRAAGDRVRTTSSLEVGPGLGSLTLGLLPRSPRSSPSRSTPCSAAALPQTVAARRPRRRRAASRWCTADALRLDALPGPAPTALVANLPYNVAVPVLLHLLARFPTLRPGAGHGAGRGRRPARRRPRRRTYGVP